jgi:hypothetical protein
VEDEKAARRSQVGYVEIVLEKAVENDIPELTEVMTRALDTSILRMMNNCHLTCVLKNKPSHRSDRAERQTIRTSYM